MGLTRDWADTNDSIDTGQAILHEQGWVLVTVQRANDNSKNVGVTQELDEDYTVFTIRARIDPLDGSQKTQKWIGMVETHLLPLMAKGDKWFTQKPNDTFDIYKVTAINSDEIELERV